MTHTMDSDYELYGPYRGDPRDPRTPDPPEAVCRTCGQGWQDGDFYEAWLANQDEDDLRHPETCPECRPEDY